jgi:hypothetical protein
MHVKAYFTADKLTYVEYSWNGFHPADLNAIQQPLQNSSAAAWTKDEQQWRRISRCFPKHLAEAELQEMMTQYVTRHCRVTAVKMFEFPDITNVNRQLIREMLGDTIAVH